MQVKRDTIFLEQTINLFTIQSICRVSGNAAKVAFLLMLHLKHFLNFDSNVLYILANFMKCVLRPKDLSAHWYFT